MGFQLGYFRGDALTVINFVFTTVFIVFQTRSNETGCRKNSWWTFPFPEGRDERWGLWWFQAAPGWIEMGYAIGARGWYYLDSLRIYCEIKKCMKMIEHMRLLYVISCLYMCIYIYIWYLICFYFLYTHYEVRLTSKTAPSQKIQCPVSTYIVVTILGPYAQKTFQKGVLTLEWTYRTNPPFGCFQK